MENTQQALEGEIIEMGRPSKYDQSYCEKMQEIMSKGRVSKGSLCAVLDIDRKTFNNWLELHQEFKDVYEKGREKGFDWWVQLGMAGILGTTPGKFGASTYNMMIHNLFPEDFKARTETISTVNINLVQQLERIKHLDDASLQDEIKLLQDKIQNLEGK